MFYCDNKAVLAAEKSRAPSLNCLFEFIKTTFGNVQFKYVESKKNPSDMFTRQPENKTANAVSTRASTSRSNVTTLTDSLKAKIKKLHANAGHVSQPTKLC